LQPALLWFVAPPARCVCSLHRSTRRVFIYHTRVT